MERVVFVSWRVDPTDYIYIYKCRYVRKLSVEVSWKVRFAARRSIGEDRLPVPKSALNCGPAPRRSTRIGRN